MTDLVSEIGTELSKKLEYKYPDKLENDIRKYLAGLKTQNITTSYNIVLAMAG